MTVNPFAEATRPIASSAPATPAPSEKSVAPTSSSPSSPDGLRISLRLEFDPTTPATPAQFPLIEQAAHQSLNLLECPASALTIDATAILVELMLPTALSVQRLAWAITQAINVASLTLEIPPKLSGRFTADSVVEARA